MSAEDTIRILLARAAKGHDPLTPEEWHRVAARTAWVRQTCAALHDAHRTMDERCSEAVERLSEEEFERLCDAEQAKVDAIRAKLQAVIDEDRWPPELHFGCI